LIRTQEGEEEALKGFDAAFDELRSGTHGSDLRQLPLPERRKRIRQQRQVRLEQR
jgi:hypothetical protein